MLLRSLKTIEHGRCKIIPNESRSLQEKSHGWSSSAANTIRARVDEISLQHVVKAATSTFGRTEINR